MGVCQKVHSKFIMILQIPVALPAPETLKQLFFPPATLPGLLLCLSKPIKHGFWEKHASNVGTRQDHQRNSREFWPCAHFQPLFQARRQSSAFWNLAAAVQQHLVTATEPHGGTQGRFRLPIGMQESGSAQVIHHLSLMWLSNFGTGKRHEQKQEKQLLKKNTC